MRSAIGRVSFLQSWPMRRSLLALALIVAFVPVSPASAIRLDAAEPRRATTAAQRYLSYQVRPDEDVTIFLRLQRAAGRSGVRRLVVVRSGQTPLTLVADRRGGLRLAQWKSVV